MVSCCLYGLISQHLKVGSYTDLCLGTFYDSLNVNLILLASIFTLFGGATHVTTALVYSEAALVTKDQ